MGTPRFFQEEVCVFCSDDFVERPLNLYTCGVLDAEKKKVVPCNHIFHMPCILEAILASRDGNSFQMPKAATCPFCRRVIIGLYPKDDHDQTYKVERFVDAVGQIANLTHPYSGEIVQGLEYADFIQFVPTSGELPVPAAEGEEMIIAVNNTEEIEIDEWNMIIPEEPPFHFQCQNCNREFITQTALTQHIARRHP